MESVITAEKQSQLVQMETQWRVLSHFGFQMCGLCRNTDTRGAGLTARANWPGKCSVSHDLIRSCAWLGARGSVRD